MSKEAVRSEFNLSFSGNSGFQYRQMLYKYWSWLNAGLTLTLGGGGPRSGKKINTQAYIREYTLHTYVLPAALHFVLQLADVSHLYVYRP